MDEHDYLIIDTQRYINRFINNRKKRMEESPMYEQNCYNIDIHECIKEKAYKLWKNDGCKEGFDLDYWLAAEMSVKSPDEVIAAKKFEQWKYLQRNDIKGKNKKFLLCLGHI